MKIGASSLEQGGHTEPLDLRKDTTTGTPASEWLYRHASVAQFGWVLNQYAALHDPFLAARIAELVMSKQRERGE